MKYTLAVSFLFLCSSNAARGQLAGTWYEKNRTYQFIQDGTAQWYVRTAPANYTQKLTVKKNNTYTYTQLLKNDTVHTTGTVQLLNDTLIFTPVSLNGQPIKNTNPQKFYLFLADKNNLIYSQKILPVETVNNEDRIFTKVETEAEYSEGVHRLLKHIYKTVAERKLLKKDTAALQVYKILISSEGKADLSTLQAVSADPVYFKAVQQSLSTLKAGFKPATQNGKNVTAFLRLRITL